MIFRISDIFKNLQNLFKIVKIDILLKFKKLQKSKVREKYISTDTLSDIITQIVVEQC